MPGWYGPGGLATMRTAVLLRKGRRDGSAAAGVADPICVVSDGDLVTEVLDIENQGRPGPPFETQSDQMTAIAVRRSSAWSLRT